MQIARHMSKWGNVIYFGPYIDWQEWDIWHRYFIIGFSFGPWDFGLQITLWDIEKTTQMLKDDQGMTEEEAWLFCEAVQRNLPDPYDSRVNMRKEIEKELAKSDYPWGRVVRKGERGKDEKRG